MIDTSNIEQFANFRIELLNRNKGAISQYFEPILESLKKDIPFEEIPFLRYARNFLYKGLGTDEAKIVKLQQRGVENSVYFYIEQLNLESGFEIAAHRLLKYYFDANFNANDSLIWFSDIRYYLSDSIIDLLNNEFNLCNSSSFSREEKNGNIANYFSLDNNYNFHDDSDVIPIVILDAERCRPILSRLLNSANIPESYASELFIYFLRRTIDNKCKIMVTCGE